MEKHEEYVILRQFDANGNGLDHSLWLCKPFELHILMFDVMIKGVASWEVVPMPDRWNVYLDL